MEDSMRHITFRKAFCLAAASMLFALAALAVPAYLPESGDRDDDLYTYGFEPTDWPPPGWAEITSSTANWSRTNWDSNSGDFSAWCWTNPATQDEWLVMPALDLSSAINPKLEFFERGYNWESAGGHHYIMVSTTSQTDTGAFDEVVHWTPSNHDIGGFEGGPPTTVNLVDYVGESTVYVAFRYYGPTGVSDAWLIDDIRIYTPSGHDVGAVAVLPDGGNMDAPLAITPQATVENFGQAPETFDVTLEIFESGALAYTQVQTVLDLDPGLQLNLDYPNFTIQPGHYYEVSATTDLAGDGDASNDNYTGTFTTYFDTHVPLGMLFTNSGCGPCVQANQALDDYIPGQGNEVALMRIHVSWPYGGDIMYQHNTAQSGALVGEFGVSGVPDFWLDAFWDPGYAGSSIVAAFNEGKTWVSPMNFDLQWVPDSDQLVVSVNITGTLPPGGDYQLFCTITEDNILHNGGNGEPIHMQAFRRMFPSTSTGVSVSGTLGTHVYTVDCPLDPIYVYEELRGTVYVRDMNSGVIMQAGTDFLSNIEDATDVDEMASAFGLKGSYPNPFNPKTRIEYALEVDGFASLQIFDPSGRLVRTLHTGDLDAGAHSAEWNGLDDAGHPAASGVYLVRLQSGAQNDMSKVLLAK
jgi:hypothetical protein